MLKMSNLVVLYKEPLGVNAENYLKLYNSYPRPYNESKVVPLCILNICVAVRSGAILYGNWGIAYESADSGNAEYL